MTRLLFAIISMILFAAIFISSAPAEEGQWKEEFQRLCSYTDVVQTLSDEELQQLVKDSGILLEKLKALDASKVKVYIFRLKKCRNMYVYAIEVKEAQQKREGN